MLRSDLIYMLWAAEKACLAFTNCFMYLFLALHLDTISSLSNLEYQQPILLSLVCVVCVRDSEREGETENQCNFTLIGICIQHSICVNLLSVLLF